MVDAGLVPLAIAGDLGEQERQSACSARSNVWFTIDMPVSTTPDCTHGEWPDEESEVWNDPDYWEMIFGRPGFTACSHMLTVTHRGPAGSVNFFFCAAGGQALGH